MNDWNCTVERVQWNGIYSTMVLWDGVVEWYFGMAKWNETLDNDSRMIPWNGILERYTGMVQYKCTMEWYSGMV